MSHFLYYSYNGSMQLLTFTKIILDIKNFHKLMGNLMMNFNIIVRTQEIILNICSHWKGLWNKIQEIRAVFLPLFHAYDIFP